MILQHVGHVGFVELLSGQLRESIFRGLIFGARLRREIDTLARCDLL